MAQQTTQAGNPTIDVRESEALDIDVIDSLLKSEVSGLSGEPRVRQYPSGASNLTYAIDYPDRRLVLRRPPFGYIPKGGHSMWREYRVMRDLKPVFPAVPNVLLYQSDDESVLGKEFYVMDRVEGHIVHLDIPKEWDWDAAKTRQLCEEFWGKLCDLHTVDYEAAGLGDFGKPEGYVERQIKGWNRRWEKAWTDDVETYDDIQQWLEDNMPKGRGASVLHGDYRIDNCILDPDDPTQVAAVLDWEIAALGDPLMDLGNTLTYWIEATDPPAMKASVRQPSMAPGMMTRKEVLDFYADRTGFDVSDMQFYYVQGIWRLAVVVQQLYRRFYDGATDDPRFKNYPIMTAQMAELARERIATGEI